MQLSPNEIAAAIYWNGAEFGPGTSLGMSATDDHGKITQTVPKPGSPARTRIEQWLDVAIAVCLAESGGDTNASNPSGAKGLWQIMVSAHTSEIKDAQTYWATNRSDGKIPSIFDPMVNTMVAALIYQKSGWAPWQAYTTGSYKRHLGHGKAAYAYLTSKQNLEKARHNFIENMKNDASTVELAKVVVPGAALANAVPDSLSSAIGRILGFLKDAGLVVGAFLIGAILILLGLWAIISRTRAGKSIKSAAKAALP